MAFTYPGPVKVNRYKRWRNGEIVHKRVEFQHEPELVRGGNKLKLIFS